MPHVTVFFDPQEFDQALVDRLKPWLQVEVASVMSNRATLVNPNQDDGDGNIKVRPEEVMVVQWMAHPTDVGVPPFEIYIRPGRTKGRSPMKVVKLLAAAISMSRMVPGQYLGLGKSGIFIRFCEDNAFGFIRNPDEDVQQDV
jgi:hypothetical protein